MNIATDEVSQQVVVIALRTGRFTVGVLVKAVKSFLNTTKQEQKSPPKKTIGQQTVGKLIAQGQGATAIEVDRNGIGAFSRILRKYQVDYAIQKDSSMMPPKYLLFFKAKDTDVIAQAFREYVNLEERRKSRTKQVQVKVKDTGTRSIKREYDSQNRFADSFADTSFSSRTPDQTIQSEIPQKNQTRYSASRRNSANITDPDLRPSVRAKLNTIRERKDKETRTRTELQKNQKTREIGRHGSPGGKKSKRLPDRTIGL